MSKCVIVLGCYRTGSSAVAGILYHLGVYMGRIFDRPDSNNPEGYFEDVEFKNLHKNMNYESYSQLIHQREQLPLWGVKDPQLCIYLPVFLENLSCKHSLISIRRSRSEISHSLKKATGKKEDFSPLVNHYCNLQEQHVINYKGDLLSLEFDDIMRDKSETVERIAEFVKVPVIKNALEFFNN